MASTDIRQESFKGHARGWSYIPLKGKQAASLGWQNAPKESWEEVERWILDGNNLGLRAGPSGLVILDIDSGSGLTYKDFPKTVTAITGGGGFHLYYAAPSYPVGNAHKQMGLPDHVHIRGRGGYVVAVGSTHPETGKLYEWMIGLEPDIINVAPFPADVIIQSEEYKRHIEAWDAYHAGGMNLDRAAIALKRDTEDIRRSLLYFDIKLPKEDLSLPPRKTPPSYGRTALDRECRLVATAMEGDRNNQLNRSSFNLGQLVAAGVLERDDVEYRLRIAAEEAGIRGIEVVRTIKSGVEGGISRPRTIPTMPPPSSQVGKDERAAAKVAAAAVVQPRPSRTGEDYVLVPGSHLDELGIEHTIGTDDFSREVLLRLPHGLVIRQAMIPGQLHGEVGSRRFVPLAPTDMRLLIDKHTELAKWSEIKRGDHKGKRIRLFVPAARDHGELTLAAASRCVTVPELRFMANYPFFMPDWSLAIPGWNNDTHYYDQPPELDKLQLIYDQDEIRHVLEDVLIDFPFAREADRQNFIGLLFTPLIRPAIQANTPLHMILSPLERTGKTLLAEQVLGCIIGGDKTPGMILPEAEEERDKRILSVLMGGKTILHFDNLKEYLDSAVLASLLTATQYQGRLLGRSQLVEVPNNLTIVATGNNVRATGEIAKRTIPICLQPNTPNPEGRQDFVHPDIVGYLKANRKRILGCLLGAIDSWIVAGRPKGTNRLGGFDAWAETVGGIMSHIGLLEWRANEKDWRRDADPVGEDLQSLATQWWFLHQQGQLKADDVLRIAEQYELFSAVLSRPTERAKQSAFGRFLTSCENKPVGRWIIRRTGSGSSRWYYLEESRLAESE